MLIANSFPYHFSPHLIACQFGALKELTGLAGDVRCAGSCCTHCSALASLSKPDAEQALLTTGAPVHLLLHCCSISFPNARTSLPRPGSPDVQGDLLYQAAPSLLSAVDEPRSRPAAPYGHAQMHRASSQGMNPFLEFEGKMLSAPSPMLRNNHGIISQLPQEEVHLFCCSPSTSEQDPASDGDLRPFGGHQLNYHTSYLPLSSFQCALRLSHSQFGPFPHWPNACSWQFKDPSRSINNSTACCEW